MGTIDLDRLHMEFLEYCRVSRALSKNTIAAYTQDLAEFAKFCVLNDRHSPPNPDFILAFVAHLRERRGLKPASVRRRIACLRRFFKWLERAHHLRSSPFRELDLHLQTPKRLPRALDRSQISAVTRAASYGLPRNDKALSSPNASMRVTNVQLTTQLAIRLMVATGVRVGELAVIELSDISPDATAIRVIGKGNRERTVFIGNQQLCSDLKRYVNERLGVAKKNEPLFVNQAGRPLTPQCLRLRLRRISESLQMSPRLTPHRLRHTAATLFLEEGLDIRFVQKLLGHSSISTTEIYTQVSDSSLKAAMERADPIGKLEL